MVYYNDHPLNISFLVSDTRLDAPRSPLETGEASQPLFAGSSGETSQPPIAGPSGDTTTPSHPNAGEKLRLSFLLNDPQDPPVAPGEGTSGHHQQHYPQMVPFQPSKGRQQETNWVQRGLRDVAATAKAKVKGGFKKVKSRISGTPSLSSRASGSGTSALSISPGAHRKHPLAPAPSTPVPTVVTHFADTTPPGDGGTSPEMSLSPTTPLPRRSQRLHNMGPVQIPNASGSGSGISVATTSMTPPMPASLTLAEHTLASSPSTMPSSGKRRRDVEDEDTPQRPPRRRKLTEKAEAAEKERKSRKPRAQHKARAHGKNVPPPPPALSSPPPFPLPKSRLEVKNSRKRRLDEDEDDRGSLAVAETSMITDVDGVGAATTGSGCGRGRGRGGARGRAHRQDLAAAEQPPSKRLKRA